MMTTKIERSINCCRGCDSLDLRVSFWARKIEFLEYRIVLSVIKIAIHKGQGL